MAGTLKTDKELISYADTYIKTNGANEITGAIHNAYLNDSIVSKLNVDAFTHYVRNINASWTFKGVAYVGDATPSGSTGDVYIAGETGTIFGVASVSQYQFLVYTTGWAKQTVGLTDVFYTETEVDGLFTTHSASGDHDGRYYTEAEIDALIAGYAADGKIKVSYNDTDTNYIFTKLYSQDNSIVLGYTNSTGGDQDINISVHPTWQGNYNADGNNLTNVGTMSVDNLTVNTSLSFPVTGYLEMCFPMTSARLGGTNDPTFDSTTGGYAFSRDNVVYFIFTLPKDWANGSGFVPKLRWWSDTTGTVEWVMSYKMADVGDDPSGTWTDLSLNQQTVTSDTGDIVQESQPTTSIPAIGFTNGSQIMIKVWRDVDSYSGTPVALSLTLTYTVDKLYGATI